ncbi:MAG: hypothetical protein LW832_08595 [Parachlamydia sp.]|jgi:hypothetical protein|nr:hypothetical protein [Parachlamydia sp.]
MPDVKYIEEELAIRLPRHDILSTPVTLDAAKYYAQQGVEAKNKIDQLAAEVNQQQEKIKLAYEIIQELNNLVGDDGSLDLSLHPALQEKLLVAKQMGINIPMDPTSTEENPLAKTKFKNEERERLLQNINLSTDEWDKEVKKLQQKMQIHLDESNRYMTMVMQCMKNEDKAKRACIQGIAR